MKMSEISAIVVAETTGIAVSPSKPTRTKPPSISARRLLSHRTKSNSTSSSKSPPNRTKSVTINVVEEDDTTINKNDDSFLSELDEIYDGKNIEVFSDSNPSFMPSYSPSGGGGILSPRISVMVSPSEPLFFNCADPCDGGEQMTLFNAFSSKSAPVSDVWPECKPDDIFYLEEEDDLFNYGAAVAAAGEAASSATDATSNSGGTTAACNNSSSGFVAAENSSTTNFDNMSNSPSRRNTLSQQSIPRLRRMTSSLLTTSSAHRRSVLSSSSSVHSSTGNKLPSSFSTLSEDAGGPEASTAGDLTKPPAGASAASRMRLHRAVSKSAEFQVGWRRFKGVFLALAAGFVFTFSSIAQKYLLETMTSTQIGLIRFLLLIGFMAPVFLIRRINPFSLSIIRHYGWMLLLRGVIGGLCFQLRTYAFAELPLGDATTIMFSSPIFVGLIAKLVLNERYQKIYFVTMLLTLAGCIMISRPKFSSTVAIVPATNFSTNITDIDVEMDLKEERASLGRLLGSSAALTSAALAACTFVVLRKLRRVDAVIVVFYFGFVGSVLSFGLTLLTSGGTIPIPTSWWEYFWIFVLAASSNLGQWLFTRSLHYENANLIALARTVDIVWAFAAQMLLFGVLPHALSISGASLVTLSVTFLGLRKLFESLDNDSWLRTTRIMRSRAGRALFPQYVPAQRPRNVRLAALAAAAASAFAAPVQTQYERSEQQTQQQRTVTFPENYYTTVVEEDKDDEECGKEEVTQNKQIIYTTPLSPSTISMSEVQKTHEQQIEPLLPPTSSSSINTGGINGLPSSSSASSSTSTSSPGPLASQSSAAVAK